MGVLESVDGNLPFAASGDGVCATTVTSDTRMRDKIGEIGSAMRGGDGLSSVKEYPNAVPGGKWSTGGRSFSTSGGGTIKPALSEMLVS